MAKKNHMVRYILIGVGLLLVFLVVGRKAGWIGEDDNIKVTAEKVSTETITETTRETNHKPKKKEPKPVQPRKPITEVLHDIYDR